MLTRVLQAPPEKKNTHTDLPKYMHVFCSLPLHEKKTTQDYYCCNLCDVLFEVWSLVPEVPVRLLNDRLHGLPGPEVVQALVVQ